MSASASETPPAKSGGVRLSPLLVVVLVIGAALLAWVLSVQAMVGMDGAPGAMLGTPLWFLWMWLVMMAAMMLPSVWPMVLAHAAMANAHARSRMLAALSCALFVVGYLISWCAYGVVAYAAYRGIAAVGPEWLAWERHGALAAGLVVIAAGLYQLTPYKRVCLQHCISPLSFIAQRWRPGLPAALYLGAKHGLWCVGCCAGLMLLLFVLGIMSLFWMGVVTALIFIEKIVPLRSIPYWIAAACIVLGIAVAAAPAWVPAIGVNPGSTSGMAM